jgi:hypothetical protein
MTLCSIVYTTVITSHHPFTTINIVITQQIKFSRSIRYNGIQWNTMEWLDEGKLMPSIHISKIVG